MTDSDGGPVAPGAAGALTAGAMLRAERERQGMHIAVLAASIKVSPRKLDALEHDRYAELPDMTFVRALAQTVCRALKVDAQPILARLPQMAGAGLGPVGGGLNAPFRERPGRSDPGTPLPQRPLVWAGVALLAAAAAILLVPSNTWDWLVNGSAADTPATTVVTTASSQLPASGAAPIGEPGTTAPDLAGSAAASASAPADAGVVETVHSVPADAPGAEAALKAVSITTSDSSWIEVADGAGQVLLSRVVLPGETVGLDGRLPLRLKIGNAQATQLVFRGQPVDLAASTRENVARLELK
ncbi:MAG TPA: helix-turn-helix domain-containing protein [Rubrivivax sp.]